MSGRRIGKLGSVLVHCACHLIPSCGVRVRGPPGCHGRDSILDLGVKPTAELDHNRLWVRVAGFRDEVLNLIDVVI